MTNKISAQEVAVYQFVVANGAQWNTTRQIAEGVGIALRTARKHAHDLSSIGIFEQMNLFPGYKYRVAVKQNATARGYARILNLAGM